MTCLYQIANKRMVLTFGTRRNFCITLSHNGLLLGQGLLPVVMGGQRSLDCSRYSLRKRLRENLARIENSVRIKRHLNALHQGDHIWHEHDGQKLFPFGTDAVFAANCPA